MLMRRSTFEAILAMPAGSIMTPFDSLTLVADYRCVCHECVAGVSICSSIDIRNLHSPIRHSHPRTTMFPPIFLLFPDICEVKVLVLMFMRNDDSNSASSLEDASR
jgi:hypothetical protein